MPISWNEIRSRAYQFIKTWENESSEHAEAKSFWDGFFHIFGKERKALAAFEFPIKKTDGRYGFVDLFWKGQLLVEHKSRGKDLDKAYDQALDYFQGLKERDLPNYVLVSDFQRFRLYDLNSREQTEFTLAELPRNISLFGFIAGYQTKTYGQQDQVNIEAAEKLGKLHDLLKESGYTGHQLEVLLVRLLFCMFAEDTGIFDKNSFREYLENRTSQDGSDLGMHLTRIFQVLDTPHQERSKLLDEQLAALEYINGMLFSENIRIPDFDSKMREAILDCCALDWSRISPAIFGSLFQSIMDNTARRNLGAHYTSETNILKLIQPLFLDELWAEFEKTKRNRNQLFEFLKKLAKLQFFDPACGCGNFLVIAYRELRLLELEVLRHVRQSDQMMLDIFQLVGVNVDQFHGIEIEEWPARIAEVALWLTDHQMNLKVSEEFGLYYARLPLKKAPHIVQGNALQIDWEDVISAHKLSYILGNPPFIGKNFRTKEQDADLEKVFTQTPGVAEVRLHRSLDYVAAWYYKAVAYMGGTSSLSRGRERAGGEGVSASVSDSVTIAGGEGISNTATAENWSGYVPNPPAPLPEDLKFFARKMRKEQTDAEQLVWSLLRNRNLKGAKFRRQHPVGRFILDFYCAEYRIAVELDGAQHAEQKGYDHNRDTWLQEQGITVLRFWNNQVLNETEAVLEEIYRNLPEQAPSPPAPLPPTGEGSGIKCAFVSTNSITQGEQVAILWPPLLDAGLKIHFAHRTFSWSNEARGKAAVHCVIIGFALHEAARKQVFEYEDIKGEPQAVAVKNINPYLIDGPDIIVTGRSKPICDAPEMVNGSKPTDGGNLLLNEQEKEELILAEPAAEKYIRHFAGSDEFINNIPRYCLWLVDCPPDELRKMPLVLKRVEAVKAMRLASTKEATRKDAAISSLFAEIRHTDAKYLIIPSTSSENRYYIPIGHMDAKTISGNANLTVPNATLYHFGILTSTMHNAWMRTVAGRLESRYRYSAKIVYNNFPWPAEPTDKQKQAIETAAQAVLDARAKFTLPSPAGGRGAGGEGKCTGGRGAGGEGECTSGRGTGGTGASLADLYDPLTMPPALLKAHQKLDKAVDAAYGKTSFQTEAERVAFLFEQYQQLTTPA